MIDRNFKMKIAVELKDFDTYYTLNLACHDLFMKMSGNDQMRKIVTPIKQRLCDFPKRIYIKEWELINCKEHDQIINFIKRGIL